MFKIIDSKSKEIRIHFIGIGGIGMSAIAEVLIMLGYTVTGSDVVDNANTVKLKNQNAFISIGHHEKNVLGATVVVYSSAVNLKSNPEVIEAKKQNIPLIKRAEMLAELMRIKLGVAVAGSHGKTTTTGFLATILRESGQDSSHIIGGIVENLGGHAYVGKGDVLVAEADESDGSFLLLNPIISVITNIDDDHLDHYKNKKRLVSSFLKFANRVPFYGKCIVNIHDRDLRRIRKKIKRPCVTFGLDKINGVAESQERLSAQDIMSELPDYQARNLEYSDGATLYNLAYKGENVLSIKLLTSGQHNVLNSLGAIAAAHQLGIDFSTIQEAISKFKGVGRRLESLYKSENFEIIDDYAHHPTEIANVLSTLRKIKKNSKIVVVFEPHRYTRTMNCWDKFLHCFNDADELNMLPIYAASENTIPGINSLKLIEDINKIHPGMGKHFLSFKEMWPLILNTSKNQIGKTSMVFLGAGAIGKNIREYLKKNKENLC